MSEILWSKVVPHRAGRATAGRQRLASCLNGGLGGLLNTITPLLAIDVVLL